MLVLAESLRTKVLDEVIAFHTELGIRIESCSIRKDDAWCSVYKTSPALRVTGGSKREKGYGLRN